MKLGVWILRTPPIARLAATASRSEVRADGGIRDMRIEGGHLTVERSMEEGAQGDC